MLQKIMLGRDKQGFGHSPPPSPFNFAKQAVMLLTALALLALISQALYFSHEIRAVNALPLSIATAPATKVALRSTVPTIVAAPVIDSEAALFIGTGDGSAGSWIRH